MASLNAPIVKPEVVFIEDLLDEVNTGKLRVPRFQRPFVWKPSDMLDLFDSIYKGYPIGSLLLWESTDRVTSLDRIGPISLPETPTQPPVQTIAYILDGQQRLATLLGGLRLQKDAPLGLDQKNWQWWIWFDLKNQEFVHVKNDKPEAWLLPLRDVTKTVDFLGKARTIQQKYEKEPRKAEEFIDKAEQLAQKLKSYKAAIIRIKGGSLAEAVEIFSRLNTQGIRMTPDQMVSALTYREGAEEKTLAMQIDEILDHLSEYYFGGIRRMTVFRAIIAAANKDIHKSEWEELAKRLGDDLPQAAQVAKEALRKAARFLYEEIGVPGDKLLPYNNQILLLSEFFHLCPEPSSKQEKTLK
jgi:hypothetical protein